MKKKKLDIFNLFYSGAAVVILIGVIAKLLEWPAQDLLITGGLAIEAVVFGVSAVKFVEVDVKQEVATEATLAKVADGLGNLDYVAREIVKAEDIIDYTRHDNVAERLAKRFGAAIGEGAVRAMQTMPAIR